MAQIYLDNEWKVATSTLIAPIMRDQRTERRLAAKERLRSAAMKRAAKIAIVREAAAEERHIKDVRRVLRELGLDKPDDAWGPFIKMRSPPSNRKRAHRPQKIIQPSRQAQPLPAYQHPLIDARGRETLYLGID